MSARSSFFMAFGILAAAAVTGCGLFLTPSHAASSAPAAPAKAGDKAPVAPAQTAPGTGEKGSGEADQNREPTIGDESAASRNAARTRLRECGHQWSTMKKSGAATGMTWKEFSQSCLTRH